MRFLSMLLALLLPAPAFAAPAFAAPPGWEHPGYDAEDSYYNPGESAINAGTIGHLRKRWSVPLRRASESCGGYTRPLVAGGLVVTTDRLGIAAYHATTGKPAWTFDWADPMDSDPARMGVSDNVLVAVDSDCNSASDPDGRIVAFDLATGRVRWRFDTDIPMYSFVVDRGLAVVSGSSESDGVQTVAYRVTDGRVVWRKRGSASSGVSAAGWLMLTSDKSTSVVSVSTGAVLWTKKSLWQAQAATRDRFLVSNGSDLSAVDAVSGRLLWTAPGQASETVATDGRRVYVAGWDAIVALHANSGQRLWSRRLGGDKPVQPVRAGGLLYTAGPILNPASGEVLIPAAPQFSNPAITGGRLYAVQGSTLSAYIA